MLVIDDEEPVRQVLTDMLEEMGHTVTQAERAVRRGSSVAPPSGSIS